MRILLQYWLVTGQAKLNFMSSVGVGIMSHTAVLTPHPTDPSTEGTRPEKEPASVSKKDLDAHVGDNHFMPLYSFAA